jgi:hypothetical protein
MCTLGWGLMSCLLLCNHQTAEAVEQVCCTLARLNKGPRPAERVVALGIWTNYGFTEIIHTIKSNYAHYVAKLGILAHITLLC